MSRIITGGIWGLALGAMVAFSAVPASVASAMSAGANSAHVLLVRGGGGGGGRGGGGFSGGGRGFSGGGARGFSSGGARAFSGGSRGINEGVRSFSQGTRSFNGNVRSFTGGNRSFANQSAIGRDGLARGDWNRGNWAWRGNGNYYNRGWRGWGYPIAAWLGGYGWGYPYYYGYDNGPYYYYGDNYAYADTGIPVEQPYSVAPQQNNPTTENDQGNGYLDEAIQSFQGGDYPNAMRMAEHAIVDSPRDAEAHEIVSLAAMANKDYRTAATEAHAVIALGGVPSWNQVYALYQNVDTYTSQLRALEDYVTANPNSAEGQFLLGVQYMTTGYSSDAHEHLAKAAELTPKDKIAQELVKGAGGEVPATANRPSGAQTK